MDSPQTHNAQPRRLKGIYALYAPTAFGESLEALGQIGGSGDLEADILLCSLQTLDPLFTKYLPREGTILEAGAGRERWVFHLRRKGYDVVGVEIVRKEIDEAKAFDPTVPIEQGAFAEVQRILRSGGLFLVTVPTQNLVRIALFHRIKSAQNRYPRMRGVPLAFEEYRYSRPQFAKLLREAGFTIIASAPDDFLPPKNMGLYNDSHFLQNPERQWELNLSGRLLNSSLSAISPWLHCSGTLWVCKTS